jgi:hypothetical protein
MSNIKGKAINSLSYTGIVRLSQYTNGKKVTIAEEHNEGGKILFNFLADCLVGDFDIARQDRPTKILLLREEDGNLAKASNTSFIYLLTRPEKVYSKENECVIRYSFIIPQEYFIGTNFNAIGLYAESADEYNVSDYAAYCYVEANEWSISRSSVLILDWELHISN